MGIKMSNKIDLDNADEIHDLTVKLRIYLNTFTSFKTPELEAELIKLQDALCKKLIEINSDNFSS